MEGETVCTHLKGHLNSTLALIKETWAHLPNMNESDICALIRSSAQLEIAAFLFRGILAMELKRRTEAQTGGRGKHDQDGTGVKQTLRSWAQEVGVALRTLERDIQIVKTFFLDEEGNLKTSVASDTLLPRKYYEVALPANNPEAAIALARHGFALAQISNQYSYTTARFENELKSQKLLDALPLRDDEADHALSRLTIQISNSSQQALADLGARWESSQERVIERLIQDAGAVSPGYRAVFLSEATHRDICEVVEHHNSSQPGVHPLSLEQYLTCFFRKIADQVFQIGIRGGHVRGVSYDKKAGKWRARRWEDGKQVCLGYYQSQEEAVAACAVDPVH